METRKTTNSSRLNTLASTDNLPGSKKLSIEPKHEIFRIQMKDKTYTDILKEVKRAANSDEIGVDVGKVPKLRNGDLKREIGEKLLDYEIASAEEVKEAISEIPESFETRAHRSTYGSMQNVGIIIQESDANTQKWRASGLQNFRQKERKEIFQIWETGHIKQHYNGLEREYL